MTEPSWRKDLCTFLNEIRVGSVERNRTGFLEPSTLHRAGELGLYRVAVPEEVGGRGGSVADFCAIQEAVGYEDAGLATAMEAQYVILRLLLNTGKALHASYFDELLSGAAIGALAMTEPDAGSNISMMQSRATSMDTNWLRLSGQKWMVHNGSFADIIVFLAAADSGTHAVLVEKRDAGLRVEDGIPITGLRSGPVARLSFENIDVPVARIVGEPGRGLRTILTGLDFSRVGMASIAIGVARAAFDWAWSHALDRRSPDGTIWDYQAVQHMLSDTQTAIIQASLLRDHAAALVNRSGESVVVETAASKLAATRAAVKASQMACQLGGAHGVLEHSRPARYLNDSKVLQITSGTDEIQLNNIARGLRSRYERQRPLSELYAAIGGDNA